MRLWYEYELKINGETIKTTTMKFRPNVIAEIVEDLSNVDVGMNSIEFKITRVE